MNTKGLTPIFLCLIFIFFSGWIYAQHNLKFTSITVEQGLSNGTVNNVFQDSRGFMWFSTNDGLNRYDGYSFTHYKNNPDDPKTISSNTIYGCYEDSKGRLWIGTYNGLNLFDRNTETFKAYKNIRGDITSISNNITAFICEDKYGYFWIPTYGGGLNRFDPDKGTFKAYLPDANNPKSFPHKNAIFITKDKQEQIWIGSDRGLSKLIYINDSIVGFDNQMFMPEKPEYNTVWTIYPYNKNKLLIGTLGTAGLTVFDINKKEFAPLEPTDSMGSENVYSLFIDSHKNIWVGTSNGAFQYNQTTKRFYNYKKQSDNPFSFPATTVWSVFEDRAGVLWFGTDNGAVKLDFAKAKFNHFQNIPNDTNSLINNRVSAFCEVKRNEIWIGTYKGLEIFNPQNKTFKHLTANLNDDKYPSHNRIYGLTQDNDKKIWISTWGGGLNCYNPKTEKFKRYVYEQDKQGSLPNNHINNIFIDSNDQIWVTSLKGLCLLDKKTDKFRIFKSNPDDDTAISHDFVTHIFEDKNGYLWLGTRNKGVDIFDKNKYKVIKSYRNSSENSNSLSSNRITQIYSDSYGNIWVGTYSGLNKYDPQKDSFVRYTTKNGLPNNQILSIEEDKNGNLWISTNYGLSKYNIDDNTFRNYDAKNGLQGNEFSPLASLNSVDDILFFGGTQGFNMFDPDSIKDNQVPPNIVVTDFKIFNVSVKVQEPNIGGRIILNKSITETNKIALSYKDYIFSFDFSALHFSSPEKNKYAYKLDGFNDDWIYTDYSRRYATYTNLEPGNYIFRVKGTNSDGIWQDEGAALMITITPPFWKTTWFRFISVIFILLIIYSIYKWRVRTIERQKEILEQQVKERTAEVVQQKEEIETQRDRIQQAFQNVKLLSDIGREISGAFSVEKILETVYENVNSLMDAAIFAIGIYKSKEKLIFFPGTIENATKREVYNHSLEQKNRLSVWCLKYKSEIIINDFETEYKNFITPKTPPKLGHSPMSIIYLPLENKDKLIGVITVHSYNKNAYTDYHVDILRNIAVNAAIALDNANAYGEILTKNTEIEKQKAEIQQQAEELASQAEHLQQINVALEKEREHTMGSIRYAQTIQKAILPLKENMDKLFESFIIFWPKDIVSGDFYWYTKLSCPEDNCSRIFITAVDCTGHGVPGAFMSMIGNRLLNEIVIQERNFEPAVILDKLNIEIIKALKQDQTDNDDGMDVCLCVLEQKNNELKVIFSGAKRPLFYFPANEDNVQRIKGDRKGIGGYHNKRINIPFTNKTIVPNNGDMIYLTSDGMIDQHAPSRKKFGSKQFEGLLNKIGKKAVDEQKNICEETLKSHMNGTNQRDDITVLGIRLKV